jgi:hypothetical protein
MISYKKTFIGRLQIPTRLASGVVALLPAEPSSAQGPCGEWSPHLFQIEGVWFGSGVHAFAAGFEGDRRVLYVGGEFTLAGTTSCANIAAWDGQRWSALGSGFSAPYSSAVNALAVFDDGTGPALIAGGDFQFAGAATVNHIAKWNGREWSSLGPGLASSAGPTAIASVRSLAVFDDGTGPALYVGGEFDRAGPLTVNHVAKWNGTSWSALASGVREPLGSAHATVSAFAVFDDATGSALYAAGDFSSAGDQPASRVARWNGTSWSALGSGIGANGSGVHAMAVYEDGARRVLVLTGSFIRAGGLLAPNIACWDGSQWSGFAEGLSAYGSALVSWNDGSGPALYVAGPFNAAGNIPALSIARWNGSTWSALGAGLNGQSLGPFALAVFDEGAGPDLFAGGGFMSAGDAMASGIARWNGTTWRSLVETTTLGRSFGEYVNCFETFTDGSTPTLYIGGNSAYYLSPAGNQPLVRWDGQAWSSPAGVLDGSVYALKAFDDDSGPALFVGGKFTHAGASSLNHVARWNGATWSPLGDGLDGDVRCFGIFDDGTGAALYVGGDFTHAGALTVNRIAKWNGSTWSALGNGILGVTPPDTVESILSFDDWTGPALYVAGYFFADRGAPANSIAKWNGTSWSSVGGPGIGGHVHAMEVYDDGREPAIYLGGDFGGAGPVQTLGVIRWNGSAWSALGSGIDEFFPIVSTLTTFDDGAGSALYVGGFFDGAGHVPSATNVARWNGSRWSSVGGGTDGWVNALKPFDDGTGPALYAGGRFQRVGEIVSNWAARWKPSLLASRRGDVNANSGDISDVLFVNGAGGDVNRVVDVVSGAPLEIRLAASPRGPLVADYVLWAWAGNSAHPIDLDRGEGRIGCFINPTPVQHIAFPQPVVCLRSPSVPSIVCRGTSERPGPASAPWTMHLSSGLRAPHGIILQGVVRDYGAANPSGFSATNATLIRVQ